MAGTDIFAVEDRKVQEAIKWMNAYAKKNNHNFEANLAGYSMQTVKFGTFELITWRGDWSAPVILSENQANNCTPKSSNPASMKSEACSPQCLELHPNTAKSIRMETLLAR